MSIGFYIFISILFIIMLFLTFFAFKRIDNEIKEYEEKGATFEDEMRRSHEFETGSIRRHIPVQIWMYVITFLLMIIAFLIYMFTL